MDPSPKAHIKVSLVHVIYPSAVICPNKILELPSKVFTSCQVVPQVQAQDPKGHSQVMITNIQFQIPINITRQTAKDQGC